MIKLKLIMGLSHDNGYVKATRQNPYVEVETEEIAKLCVESGYFARVTDEAAPSAPEKPQEAHNEAAKKPTPDKKSALEAKQSANNAGDELDTMTVTELRAYAETVGIDLGKANKRVDIIAAIRKAEENA